MFYGVPEDTLIQTSEVVNILSEYRGFVVKGTLEALHHYQGDFRYYPDTTIIEQAIKDYIDAPAGYTIDFGVTDKGETILIECNDGWSIGSYGCDPSIYVRLLVARWMEIMK